MNLANKTKVVALLLGDVIALYFSLFVTLLARYGNDFYGQFTNRHFLPFTIIFPFWLIIFYIAGLYDLRRLRNNLEFIKILWLAIFINAVIAVFFFYLLPIFIITPKTNLFLFAVIFAILEMLWRRWFNLLASSGEAPNKVLLVGNGETAAVIRETISANPQLGYEIKARLNEEKINDSPGDLEKAATSNNVNVIVIPRHFKNRSKPTEELYNLLNRGIEIRDVANFYELIMRKVPLADLEESWFLENLAEHQKFYDPLKRAWEFLAALAIGIALLPLELAIAVLVKLTSQGPVFIRQKRVGRLGKQFTLYKFRSMVALAPDGQAETKGPQWSTPADPRVTVFGKFLRYTHLDELPQLINIIKSELSFVGPRPERPEFVKVLKEKIPYYEVRMLVKPGVTGWAQINHRKDTTTEDVIEKLQYDIYYIKNRSPILDLAIVLRTIKSLFVTPK